MQSFPIKLYLKGNSTMIDALYNYRQGDIHSAEMRVAYKVGFKDGATMMQEIQD